MSDTTPKYVYSHNGEDSWVEHEDSAVDSAMFGKDDQKPDSVKIYRGEAKGYTHDTFAFDIGTDIQELLQEYAHGEGGEFAEDYLEDLSKEQLDDLTSIVTEWLNKNAAQPTFYGVKNVKAYEVKL